MDAAGDPDALPPLRGISTVGLLPLRGVSGGPRGLGEVGGGFRGDNEKSGNDEALVCWSGPGCCGLLNSSSVKAELYENDPKNCK